MPAICGNNTGIGVAHELGSAWVGQGTTNLAFTTGGVKDWMWTAQDTTNLTETEIVANQRYALERPDGAGTGTVRLYIPLSKLTNGETYTVSLKYRVISGTTFGMTDWCEETLLTNVTETISDYYYTYASGTKATYDATFRYMDFNIAANTKVEIWDIQVEESTTPSPYVQTIRDAGQLEYNFYNCLNLDWSSDWTIAYWKYPVSTDAGDLTGASYESLGTSVGGNGAGSYILWGKQSGSNQLAGVATTFDPADYFNKWHFISLVRSGTTVTITEHINNQEFIRTITETNTYPDMYVTPYGYDFKFGWDDANPSNAYFRDFMIVQKAMTNTELLAMKNTYLQATKLNLLQIQHQFVETSETL